MSQSSPCGTLLGSGFPGAEPHAQPRGTNQRENGRAEHQGRAGGRTTRGSQIGARFVPRIWATLKAPCLFDVKSGGTVTNRPILGSTLNCVLVASLCCIGWGCGNVRVHSASPEEAAAMVYTVDDGPPEEDCLERRAAAMLLEHGYSVQVGPPPAEAPVESELRAILNGDRMILGLGKMEYFPVQVEGPYDGPQDERKVKALVRRLARQKNFTQWLKGNLGRASQYRLRDIDEAKIQEACRAASDGVEAQRDKGSESETALAGSPGPG